MSASRFSYFAFVGFVTSLVALFAMIAVIALPHAHHATAQETPPLTFTFTASTTKAKIGDFVAYRVLVENTGTTTIPSLGILLGLPDALDARAVNCPGETHDTVTSCDLGEFAPGSVSEVLFIVEVGAKEPNGPVTAFAFNEGNMLTSAQLPPLKIVGPSRR
jgi:hypothetical protein